MENRVKKVRAILKSEKLDGLLVSSNINIRYLTGFDGFPGDEREGYALITSSNLYMLASSLQAEGVREKIKGSSIKVVELTAQKRLIPSLQEIITSEKLEVIGFEENLTYSEYTLFKKIKGVKIKPTEDIIEEIRIIKDQDELDFLQEACKLTDETFSNILTNVRLNITEKELAWEIEKFIKEHGGELAFPTIVAFEKHSAIPHHMVSSKKLEANSCILLDFGAKINGYHADMSRTLFFGKAPVEFKKMYEAVKEGQEAAFRHSGDPDLSGDSRIKNARSWTPVRDALQHNAGGSQDDKKITPEIIDKAARNYITQQGFPSIPHSVGHGVGLAVHELPHISPGFKEVLEPNTAFTIEPGIYINGIGGVRIEDTVYYDGEKIITLTNSYKNLMELS